MDRSSSAIHALASAVQGAGTIRNYREPLALALVVRGSDYFVFAGLGHGN